MGVWVCGVCGVSECVCGGVCVGNECVGECGRVCVGGDCVVSVWGGECVWGG